MKKKLFSLSGKAVPLLFVFLSYLVHAQIPVSARSVDSHSDAGAGILKTAAACIPVSTSAELYISNVQFLGTLNPDTNRSSGYSVNGYEDNTGLADRAKQVPGGVINMNVSLTGSLSTIKAWVDWDNDGVYAGSEKIYDTSTLGLQASNVIYGYQVPPGTLPGIYTVRVRTSDATGFGPCDDQAKGEIEDYGFEVIQDCVTTITGVSAADQCGAGPVTLSASGSDGTVSYQWYSSEYGAPIAGATGSTYTTPVLAVGSYTYYVTASNGTCESAYRTPVRVVVSPTPTIAFSLSSPDICGTGTSLTVSSSGDMEEVNLLEEKFETPSDVKFVHSSEGHADPQAVWQLKSSPYIPETPPHVVKPALSSGYNGGNFGYIISDTQRNANLLNHYTLINSLNSAGYTSLKLDFDLYYFSEEDDVSRNNLKVQYSYDGGSSWKDLKVYFTDVGVPSRFYHESIPLPPPGDTEDPMQLKFRFSLFAFGTTNEWIGDIVAIDNIRIYGNRSLSTNFSWGGDTGVLYGAGCAGVPPVGGSPSVCIKPSDSDLENKTHFTVTASATLSNGCTATGTIMVPNSSKIWNNPADTDWADAKWKPAPEVPDAGKCVIIKKPVLIHPGSDGLAKNITVEPGGKLNINGSLKVTDWVKNMAAATDVVVESDGSLVQVNEGNTINTGSITAKRTITLSGGRQQYNYIISPVEGQNLKTIYSGIDYVLYHNEANNFFYSSSGAYIKGRGLAVKEPNKTGVPAKTSTVDAVFTGYPTNGAFTYGLVNSNTGNMAKRGFNLIGNPYPSNLDLIALYGLNGGSVGTISSTFYLWDNRANSQTVQMGDSYGQQAYAQFNAVDDTGILATGDAGLAGTHMPDRYVKMGQGFMTQSKVASQQLQFNNTIRTTNKGTVSFFGKESSVNRYWLNMITPNHLAAQIAVVYFEGGNNALTGDDSFSMGGSDAIYSIVEGEKVSINGRSSFTDGDVVPLGSAHFTAGNYTITVQAKEGVFASGQPIYLKDKQTGILTNLSQGSYSFSASAGESTGRFELVYKPEMVLATDGELKEEVQVYRDGDRFVVKTQSGKITGLEVYDASGKLMSTMQPNSTKAVIDGTSFAQGMYLIRINRNGEIMSRKILK
ncbi:T9SS type A sorting domain-containing protein [Kaistella sp. DKR-2]|uniref:GEVED domain-containing protein n=1 Tax=Kaistella soli TaxID=2849654 RepID=UPI001C277699|nr:GEVED domain-containing protein [Kaistella soli]MBU8882734.1 T9SS type A sorting domain-containing protein [Kaistella soli]